MYIQMYMYKIDVRTDSLAGSLTHSFDSLTHT